MKLTVLILVILVTVLALPAFADWTVTNLMPGYNSSASGISGNQQTGSVSIGTSHASLWSGTAASWIDLNPAGYISSEANDTSGSQQVGRAHMGSYSHAGLWNGTADSWVDLHPNGAILSNAYGVYNGQQAGSAKMGDFWHAGLWSGTANSWMDINPTGYISSVAFGISNNQQVGWATKVGDNNIISDHAGIWNGTAGSWIDINPAGAINSYTYNTSGDQQVGAAYYGDNMHAPIWGWHAGLWSGTKSSWIDLNPTGSEYSEANGISGGLQVGTNRVVTHYGGGINPDVNNHASLWRGTAESWEDLHLLLPTGGYSASYAKDIYVSGSTISIVGIAYNTHGGFDAILWQYTPVPEPSNLLALCGGVVGLLAFRRQR